MLHLHRLSARQLVGTLLKHVIERSELVFDPCRHCSCTLRCASTCRNYAHLVMLRATAPLKVSNNCVALRAVVQASNP